MKTRCQRTEAEPEQPRTEVKLEGRRSTMKLKEWRGRSQAKTRKP